MIYYNSFKMLSQKNATLQSIASPSLPSINPKPNPFKSLLHASNPFLLTVSFPVPNAIMIYKIFISKTSSYRVLTTNIYTQIWWQRPVNYLLWNKQSNMHLYMKLHNMTKLNYKLMRPWLFDLNIKNLKKLPCIKTNPPDRVQSVVVIVMANLTTMTEPVNAQPGVRLVNIVTNPTTLFKYATRNHLKMPIHSMPTSPTTM